MQWLWWFGGALVLGLAAYAAYLWAQVLRLEQVKQKVKQERLQQLQGQLAVMTRAVLTEQVNLTEGVLRISAMLQTIEEPVAADVAVIHEMAETALQFAIGEARSQLPRAEREHQDEVREALESRYEEAVKAAAKRLQAVLPEGVIGKMLVANQLPKEQLDK